MKGPHSQGLTVRAGVFQEWGGARAAPWEREEAVPLSQLAGGAE